MADAIQGIADTESDLRTVGAGEESSTGRIAGQTHQGVIRCATSCENVCATWSGHDRRTVAIAAAAGFEMKIGIQAARRSILADAMVSRQEQWHLGAFVFICNQATAANVLATAVRKKDVRHTIPRVTQSLSRPISIIGATAIHHAAGIGTTNWIVIQKFCGYQSPGCTKSRPLQSASFFLPLHEVIRCARTTLSQKCTPIGPQRQIWPIQRGNRKLAFDSPGNTGLVERGYSLQERHQFDHEMDNCSTVAMETHRR